MGTMDFTEQFKGLKITENQDINILLLGETGVGKSTFVNSIANYLHYKHFKKASKEQLLILIPSVINVTDKNYESVTIRVGSEDNNEYQEVGAAGTQDVKTYVFPIGEGKTRLRFIDSPGMGDPRGIEQDDINCENILAYLSQLKELHAICFLMKPTNTRITVFFEYCVKQILSRLEKSASKNIIFIFTNTRGTNYTPGDTLPCLKKVVDEIKAKPPHVEIPLKHNNIFNLDNEAFRYLVAIKHNIQYNESVQERFIESWNNSSKECWRLISYIVGDTANDPLKPHQLQNTMSINEARRLIIQLSQPLADISQLIYDNLRILERHRNNLKMENQSLDELKKKLYMPILDLEVTQLTQPVTVCTSSKCAEMIKVGESTKPHYRQRCHDPCYLTSVKKDLIGDPNLAHCAAMNGRVCLKCTCDYLVHMHVYYMTKTVEKNQVDTVVQTNINKKEIALKEAQRLIGEIDRRKSDLEEERDIIIKSTAQFAHFLQNNAISPFNDSYKAYIQYLVSREQSLGRNGDQGMIDHLKQLLRQYDEIKEAFDKSLNFTQQHGLNVIMSNQVTPQTIIQTIHKLYQLKHNGKKIHELIKKQKSSRNSEYDKSCEYVHPSTTGVYVSDKKQGKSKKDKKKDGKSTDDEKSKKDKKSSNSGDNKKFEKNTGRGNFHNRGFRPPNNQQRSHTSTDYTREAPPPYPGIDPYLSQRTNSYPGPSKSDSESNVIVKVELSHPKKDKKEERTDFNRQSSYHSDHYYGGQGPPPTQNNYVPPLVQGNYYPPPSQGNYGPPPPQGYYHGPPPPQGHYNSGGPYQGIPPNTFQGQYSGPSSGQWVPSPYGQHYGPPQNQYHGPPQGPYYEGPRGQYTGGSRGHYQKSNNRGGHYNKRGGGKGHERSKSHTRRGKKSGTERSQSSDSDSGSD